LFEEGYLTGDFITPDDLVKQPQYLSIENEIDRYIKAMQDAEETRYKMLEDGISFSFETVFSDARKINFIQDAIVKGYLIDLIFVGTLDPSINLLRVAKRVASGGHDVPPNKVLSRWVKSFNNLELVIQMINKVTLFDNSENHPELVATKDEISIMTNAKFVGTVWEKYMRLLGN